MRKLAAAGKDSFDPIHRIFSIKRRVASKRQVSKEDF